MATSRTYDQSGSLSPITSKKELVDFIDRYSALLFQRLPSLSALILAVGYCEQGIIPMTRELAGVAIWISTFMDDELIVDFNSLHEVMGNKCCNSVIVDLLTAYGHRLPIRSCYDEIVTERGLFIDIENDEERSVVYQYLIDNQISGADSKEKIEILCNLILRCRRDQKLE